jgi:carboxyl-terminal processing protease
MRSDDDKIPSQSESPTDDQSGRWTPADLPEGGWTSRSPDANPWSSPLAAPEESPLSQPAAEPWSPAPTAEPSPQSPPTAADPWAPPPPAPAPAPVQSPQSPPAVQGWPPAQPNQAWPPAPQPAWPPAQGWQSNQSGPPYQGWPPQPNQSWPPQPNQSWPPQPNQSWPPQPPAPPQWNGPVGTDRPLPSRPSRLPQILILIAACMLSFSGGLVVDHVAFGSATPATSAQSTDNGLGGSLQGSGLYEEALQVIRQNFVGRSSLTDQQLLYGSIKGLVDSLGDTGHSVFLTPDEAQALQKSLGATVVGIGVLMSSSSGSLTINKVVAGSPAAAAGLKPGDLITAVDGVSTTGMTIDQVGPRIRGPEGTTVKITVVRSGSATPLDFTITRAQIAVPLVEWGIVPGTHVADIALAQFDSGASDQLKTAMNEATTAGATSIVLDLRGNPGGYASEATSVASQFLADGVVYIEQDASGNDTSIRVDTSQPHTNLPLVVLVDHNSASSSEIVTGALQDSGRAKVVGVATFGTGTVLQQFQLSDGSVVILGTKYWLTPSGHKIFGVGITPDEAVTLPSGAVPLDPSALGSMTAAQLNSSGDAELLAAVHDLTP